VYVCVPYIQAANGQWANGLIKNTPFLYFTYMLYKNTSEHLERFFFFFLRTGLIYQKIVFLIPSCLSLEPQGLGLVL